MISSMDEQFGHWPDFDLDRGRINLDVMDAPLCYCNCEMRRGSMMCCSSELRRHVRLKIMIIVDRIDPDSTAFILILVISSVEIASHLLDSGPTLASS